MAIAYPSNLPCFLREESWEAVENIITANRYNGATTGRRKFPSAPPAIHSVKLYLTADEVNIWQTFVKTTLDYVAAFDAPIRGDANVTSGVDAAGKPTTLITVNLLSSAYSIERVSQNHYTISNIKLIEVV